MIIDAIPISSLAFDPANARKHSPKNLDSIKGSLARFGQQKPIVIGKNGVVIAGNGTLEAARSLGWETINVVRTELEGTEATAFAIADNRTGELAEWDAEILGDTLKSLQDIGFDLESIGFDDDDLAKMLATEVPPEGLTDPDEVPEDVETRCKPGDLWVLGKHRLLCGDSTSVHDVANLFRDGRAKLCFTSPPYADQRDYNGGKELSTEHLATFIRAAHGLVDLFAVNLGISRKNGEVNQYWDDYIKEAKAGGLKLLSWNVWNKGVQGSIGHLTAMFPIAHEWIFIFGEERTKLNKTVQNKTAGITRDVADRQADGTMKKKPSVTVADKRALGTVLDMTGEMARNHGASHPAMFPVALPEAYIEACTNPADGIYEPFAGSGSTLIACEKTARRCFGMELDPRYCDVILARWERFTGKTATLTTAKDSDG